MDRRGVDDAVLRWSSEISLQPDWLDKCDFAQQSPDLCYLAEDGEGDILGDALRPGLSLFGSEAVQNPSSGQINDAEMKKTCSDVIFYVGGSIWALDWCPCRSGWASQNILNEFLLVGAHQRQSPHHRLGEPLRGKGLLQIWAIDLIPGKSSLVNGDGATSLKCQGRGGKLVRSGRGKGRVGGRGRGRPRLQFSEPEVEDSGDENFSSTDNSTPSESPPETLDAWMRGSAHVRHGGTSRAVEASPSSRKALSSKSLGLLPKIVLCIAHEGEVTWDAKWRPVSIDERSSANTDERESMRLGFLAVILGDGSIQVFDVPLPKMWEVNGTQQLENEPLTVRMNPIFHSSDLQGNGHKSIPLSVEWSTWAPHDLLLVGCHDGTVAVFKVFPYATPLQDSRPLLFFIADSMTIRSIAWAPTICGVAGKHLVATASHSGWVRFWDLRDPYQPVYELQISRGVVTCIDWVSDPRCMLISMDDGSVRILALDKAATDTAVSGKPYTGTPTQGLASYFASYFAMWGVHVSQKSGLVAYCGTDGSVHQFQLTEKALIKEGSRYRQPHFLCGAFAADTETGIMFVVTQNLAPPPRTQKTPGDHPAPQFRQDFLTHRNAVLKSKGAGSGFIPSGNPLDMEKPVKTKKDADATPGGNSTKRKKLDGGDEVGEEGREPAAASQKPSGAVHNLPQRVVAVQRVRWNSNRGKETWLAYGGAAGIIRCQYVFPNE